MAEHLPFESIHLRRFVAKFLEDGKIDRLVQLHSKYARRLLASKPPGESEVTQEEDDGVALLRRLDAGLGVLQHIDYVLGFLSWRCRSKSQAIIKLALAKYVCRSGHC